MSGRKLLKALTSLDSCVDVSDETKHERDLRLVGAYAKVTFAMSRTKSNRILPSADN